MKEEIQGNKSRVLEICRNLTQSIDKAKRRTPPELKNNLNTHPSASAKGLQRVLDRIMKEHDIKTSEL